MSCTDAILALRTDTALHTVFDEPENGNTKSVAAQECENLERIYGLFFEALCLPNLPVEVTAKMKAFISKMSVETKNKRELTSIHDTFLKKVLKSKQVLNLHPIATAHTANLLFNRYSDFHNRALYKKNQLLLQDVVRNDEAFSVAEILDLPSSDDTFIAIFKVAIEIGDFKKIATMLDTALEKRKLYPIKNARLDAEGIVLLGERLAPYSNNIYKISFTKQAVDQNEKENLEDDLLELSDSEAPSSDDESPKTTQKEDPEGEIVYPLYIHKAFLRCFDYFNSRLDNTCEISIETHHPKLMRHILEAEFASSNREQICSLSHEKGKKVEIFKNVMATAAALLSREIEETYWEIFSRRISNLNEIAGKKAHSFRRKLATVSGLPFIHEKYIALLAAAIGKGDKKAIKYGQKKFGQKDSDIDFRVGLMRELAVCDRDIIKRAHTEHLVKFLKPICTLVTEQDDYKKLFSIYSYIAHTSYESYQARSEALDQFFVLLGSQSIAYLVDADKQWDLLYHLEKLIENSSQQNRFSHREALVNIIRNEKDFLRAHDSLHQNILPNLYNLAHDDAMLDAFSASTYRVIKKQ